MSYSLRSFFLMLSIFVGVMYAQDHPPHAKRLLDVHCNPTILTIMYEGPQLKMPITRKGMARLTVYPEWILRQAFYELQPHLDKLPKPFIWLETRCCTLCWHFNITPDWWKLHELNQAFGWNDDHEGCIA